MVCFCKSIAGSAAAPKGEVTVVNLSVYVCPCRNRALELNLSLSEDLCLLLCLLLVCYN